MPAVERANVDLSGVERRELDLKGKAVQVEVAVLRMA
jgi:hypothetical protein